MSERFSLIAATKGFFHGLALTMIHSLSRERAPAPLADKPTPSGRPQLLVIEDETDVAALLRLHLSELPADVRLAADGEHGLALALSTAWDLIVLDLRLPRLGGLEVCREIRASGRNVPILILTARAGELDRVHGLELGADDYVSKPFSVLELRARVKALLRRAAHSQAARSAATQAQTTTLQFGALRLDRSRHKATLGGRDLALAPREWDLLCFFAEHPGQAFSRAELLDRVWGYGHDGYNHTVNSHINRLRAKLGDERSVPCYIHTVWGLGYRFEAAGSA
jgi:DNA-binding response OmpR family regulator